MLYLPFSSFIFHICRASNILLAVLALVYAAVHQLNPSRQRSMIWPLVCLVRLFVVCASSVCVCCVCCLFALTFCHLICCCRCRLVSCLVRTAPTGLPLLDLTRTWTGTGTGSATVTLVPFQAAGKSGYRVRRELGIGYCCCCCWSAIAAGELLRCCCNLLRRSQIGQF